VPNGQAMRLKRHYSIVAHSADVVELRHGTWNPVSFTLADESRSGHLFRVLRRLDGQLTAAQIAAAEGISTAEVDALVDHLAGMDLLEEHATHALDYYLDHVVPSLMPYRGDRRVAHSEVILLGDPSVTEQVASILASSALGDHCRVHPADEALAALLRRPDPSWMADGLEFEEAARPFAEWRGKLVVFAGATVNPLASRAFNRVSLHHRIPWIHAAVDGPFLLVGPAFVPFRSPCYECLEGRVLMNLREAASYQSYTRALAEGRIAGTLAPLDGVLQSMLASLTAFEALNFLLTGVSFTVGKMLAVYLPTLEFTFNEVLRLPGCPACSPAPERDDRELFFDVRALLNGAH
jgi:bacteriocin biosynthesis cyclodehydratase domain-containing protein